jgi:hypothetical protein
MRFFRRIFRLEFHGLKIARKDAETIFLVIDANTSKEAIRKFLILLHDKYQITFFDNSAPQISDPGAYVWAQRMSQETYAFSLHNHGWSSEWKQINKEQLVEYIYSNRQFNCGNFKVYPYRIKAELGK